MGRVAASSKFRVMRPLHLRVNRREFITLLVLQAPGVAPQFLLLLSLVGGDFFFFFLATYIKKELRKFNSSPR